MTTSLAPGNESISMTAILIIAGLEPAGSIISRQWVSSNYGSARSCKRTRQTFKREMLDYLPDYLKRFDGNQHEIIALSSQNLLRLYRIGIFIPRQTCPYYAFNINKRPLYQFISFNSSRIRSCYIMTIIATINSVTG